MSDHRESIRELDSTFYSEQSLESDPGSGDRFAGLPKSAAELTAIVQNLVIHREASNLFKVELPSQRKSQEAETRYVSDILDVIQDLSSAPLGQPRPPDKRFAGTCRDFCLLLCSMLRASGTPARIRCGFASYFIPERWEDHWVAEYWEPGDGWTLVDAELGPEESKANGINFDPLNVPRDHFMVAGEAWHQYRTGAADPEVFGVGFIQIQGPWFIRNNVIRDLAALNKHEVLPWDEWGSAEESFGATGSSEFEALDRVSELERAGGPLSGLRQAYDNHQEWRVPPVVTSHTTYLGTKKVTLRVS